MMKKYTFFTLIVAAFLLSSCKDSYDLSEMQNPRKLVVYAFPSEADTTFISVTNSVGVMKYTDTRKVKNVTDAQIDYRVNGEPRSVQTLDDGSYFVVGGQKAGDRIDLQVAHRSFQPVSSSTVVPESVPVSLQRVVAVDEFDADYGGMRSLHKLLATFTDPAETTDYYAVRVCMKAYKGYGNGIYTDDVGNTNTAYVDSEEKYNSIREAHPEMEWDIHLTDSATFWPTIVTNDEPLLNPLMSIDEDFGYENNFYGNLCIFSDELINGQTYTLHLNIGAYVASDLYNFGKCYQVVLYRISHEYYRFLKSVNDLDNNELAEGGFAVLMPTYTNIMGGAGVLAGCNAACSEWKSVTNP